MTKPTTLARERSLTMALAGRDIPPAGWKLESPMGLPPRLVRELDPFKNEGVIVQVSLDGDRAAARLTTIAAAHRDLSGGANFDWLAEAIDAGDAVIETVRKRNTPKYRKIELTPVAPVEVEITAEYLRGLAANPAQTPPKGWTVRNVKAWSPGLYRTRPDGTVLMLYVGAWKRVGEGTILCWDGLSAGWRKRSTIDRGDLDSGKTFDVVEGFWQIEDFVRAEEAKK